MASQPSSIKKGRGLRTAAFAVLAFVVVVVTAIVIAYGLGWIGTSGTPNVYITNLQTVITDFPDCTATFNYVIHNNGTAKAYVDIDYLDNGWVVAGDFYIVEAGASRYVEHSIHHVSCDIQHDYQVRIVAVS